jgi:hypothetical protein
MGDAGLMKCETYERCCPYVRFKSVFLIAFRNTPPFKVFNIIKTSNRIYHYIVLRFCHSVI